MPIIKIKKKQSNFMCIDEIIERCNIKVLLTTTSSSFNFPFNDYIKYNHCSPYNIDYNSCKKWLNNTTSSPFKTPSSPSFSHNISKLATLFLPPSNKSHLTLLPSLNLLLSLSWSWEPFATSNRSPNAPHKIDHTKLWPQTLMAPSSSPPVPSLTTCSSPSKPAASYVLYYSSFPSPLCTSLTSLFLRMRPSSF